MLARDPLPLLTALFVILIAVFAYAAQRLELAVYALSFWHYLVYALAFLWRAIPHERFIRDSLILKCLSLAAFVLVLSMTIPNVLSLIVMAIGFTFNIAAARALGKERTYYGYELAALPPKHITSFPYSLTAHPMLIGNMLAYGGTLLDETFRQAWWPLGVLHVILNLLIILNEAYGSKSRSAGFIAATGGLGIGAALLLAGFSDVWPYTLAVVITSALFGYVIMRRYA
ncbi:MAG: methyltransferase [Geminicoccaceae bacterium]